MTGRREASHLAVVRPVEGQGLANQGAYISGYEEGGQSRHLVLLFAVVAIHQRYHVLHPLQPAVGGGEGVAAVAEPLVEDVLAVRTEREFVIGGSDRVRDA